MPTWYKLGLLLVLGGAPFRSFSQNITLSGHVTEIARKDHPIKGAQICVNGKVLGTSAPDGSYQVMLPGPGKLVVVYQQVRYSPRTYSLDIKGPIINDAELFENTSDSAYWASTAESIKGSIGLHTGTLNGWSIAWQQIDASALSPDAKAAAAKQLYIVLPEKSQAPKTLLLYKDVDAANIQLDTKYFQQALQSLTPGSYFQKNANLKSTLDNVTVPAPVAADIAADQITSLHVSTHAKKTKVFYQNFNEKFGIEAGARLKTQLKQKDATALPASPVPAPVAVSATKPS